ncbi:MAG: TonB-dependent receptor [Acetobacteraceae bacterium]
MSKVKAPRSLRGSIGTGRASLQVQSGVGLMTAMCLASSAPTLAQTGPTQLPEMTIDAPTPRAPARRTQPRPAAPVEAQPAATEPQEPAAGPATPGPAAPAPTTAASAQPGTGGTGGPPVAKDANPYANPAAPFYVERSANTKLTEPVADIPRSVTIIPKEVIEDKGATSLRELVRTTPGMTLGSGEGGNAFGDRVLIRGFDARNDMYIDGLRQSGVTTRETFNAEQVEILAGPSSSIFGRGTTGGAINIVTKKPLTQNFYDFTGTLGTDQTKRFTMDLNQNVSDKFAIRLNTLVQGAFVSGRNDVTDNRYGFALSTLLKPNPDIRISADYFFVYFDQLPDWGVPFDPRRRLPFTESGLNRSNFYGLPNRDFQHNWQQMGTAGIEWNIRPDIILTSKLRYSYTQTDYVAMKPGTPNLSNPNPSLWTVPSTPASRYQTSQMLSNQTDVTFRFDTYGLQHTLVSGLELSREEISQDTYANLSVECFPNCTQGTTGVIFNLWNPDPSLVFAGSPSRAGRPNETTVNTVSGYVLDTVNWNDRLYLNLGGRLDNYNIEKTPFGSTTLSRSDLMFNWNAGVMYKVVPTVGVYAAYGTSSNPVGSELDANGDAYGGLAANNVVFKPEQNTAAEVGVKWEVFDRRLLLTAALFQTTKQNARETIGTGANAVLQDTAAYRVRGIDLGFAGNITDRWSVFGGAVFMNTKMTESAIPSQVGLPLANIANNSFNLLTRYRVTDQLTVGAQATYKSEILGGTLQAVNYAPGTVNVGGVTTATPGGYNKLPGGWRFDLMADYKITDNLTAKVQVLNLFNQVLYDAFYRSQNPYVYIAPGRVAYFTLQAKF